MSVCLKLQAGNLMGIYMGASSTEFKYMGSEMSCVGMTHTWTDCYCHKCEKIMRAPALDFWTSFMGTPGCCHGYKQNKTKQKAKA